MSQINRTNDYLAKKVLVFYIKMFDDQISLKILHILVLKIIIVECMALKVGILVVKNNDFLS